MDYRTVLITGASSGIGEALAREISASGVTVVLIARRGELLEQLAEEIGSKGGRAFPYPLDITDTDALRSRFIVIDKELDGIDTVVACAGVSKVRWSGKMEWFDYARTIDVNVRGSAATLTALLPAMLERKRGHLVGISSLAGYRGIPRMAAYSASKAFLSTFLESLRVDLGKTGIRVTDIRPGYVRTPLNEGAHDQLSNLVEVDEAAKIIWKGIRQGRAVVEFPWQTVALMRSLATLPNAVYDPAARRVL